jgi:Protein of unknown function (DUF2786)
MSERNIDVEAKIMSLLELSKSQAEGTEHEAKLALEMAIRLAMKHNIDINKLAKKRESYAGGDWFKGSTTTANKADEYTDERFAEVALQRWAEVAEKYGWERHRRIHDDKEGLILMYRQPNRTPKMEVRIFERPWQDIEFEVLRNPDPILGKFEEWMNKIFDIVDLGVTFFDFQVWMEKDKVEPVQ